MTERERIYVKELNLQDSRDIGHIASKIINHRSVLTVTNKDAWLDYWSMKVRAQPVPMNIAWALIESGLVGMESGNLETGERHYTYFDRERFNGKKIFKNL